MQPPPEVVPPEIWAEVVRRLGDLVIAKAETVMDPGLPPRLVLVPQDDVLCQVREVLQEFDSGEDREAWELDGDWWKR